MEAFLCQQGLNLCTWVAICACALIGETTYVHCVYTHGEDMYKSDTWWAVLLSTFWNFTEPLA